ncbi:MAG: hypothetical protein QNJ49_12505 [Mastigocoleus sp. MO_167.B18]|nr:hypothetical protein [Mastigocoleus sp. MO_167.B18]
MSQRDGFGSGFLTGALVGGVVGGIVGAIFASRRDNLSPGEEELDAKNRPLRGREMSAKIHQMSSTDGNDLDMEIARRSLEDKIAQLNATIDDVRQQLGNVNDDQGRDNDKASIGHD